MSIFLNGRFPWMYARREICICGGIVNILTAIQWLSFSTFSGVEWPSDNERVKQQDGFVSG
jgi:hypothetical protein